MEISSSIYNPYTIVKESAISENIIDELRKISNKNFSAKIHPANKDIVMIDLSSLDNIITG